MEKERTLIPGKIYRHFKNRLYQIITVAYDAETKEAMVVYQALYGDFKAYIRPLNNFLSEVEHDKYPEVTQKYRFELCNLEEQDKQQEPAEQNLKEKVVTGASISATEPSLLTAEKENASKTVTEEGVNPILLQFLDADSYYKKLEAITTNRKHLNDRLINDMAVALDCAVEEGPLDTRIQGLIYCLEAMCRFENKRLR